MSQEQEPKVIAQAAPSRLEQIIQDPMQSAIAATACTALAVCVVLSGIWIISASVY